MLSRMSRSPRRACPLALALLLALALALAAVPPSAAQSPVVAAEDENPPPPAKPAVLSRKDPRYIPKQASLALCVVAKDEHPFLREWLRYHLNMGVQKFYIYDHNSTTPLHTLLEQYIRWEVVKYRHFVHYVGDEYQEQHPQTYAYTHCLRNYGHLHRWMGFIDPDEFVVPMGNTSMFLPDVLSEYEEFGGLAMNWRMFGSSGHKQASKEPVLLRFTQCAPPSYPPSRTTKLFVRPHAVDRMVVHSAWFRPPYYAVNERKEPVHQDKEFTERSTVWAGDRLVLHHYATKSWEEAALKMAKGCPYFGFEEHKNRRNMTWLQEVDAASTDTCTRGAEMYSLLKVEPDDSSSSAGSGGDSDAAVTDATGDGAAGGGAGATVDSVVVDGVVGTVKKEEPPQRSIVGQQAVAEPQPQQQ